MLAEFAASSRQAIADGQAMEDIVLANLRA